MHRVVSSLNSVQLFRNNAQQKCNNLLRFLSKVFVRNNFWSDKH